MTTQNVFSGVSYDEIRSLAEGIGSGKEPTHVGLTRPNPEDHEGLMLAAIRRKVIEAWWDSLEREHYARLERDFKPSVERMVRAAIEEQDDRYAFNIFDAAFGHLDAFGSIGTMAENAAVADVIAFAYRMGLEAGRRERSSK